MATNDVASISISLPDNPPQNIWSSVPSPVGSGNSKNWQGSVGDFPGEGENYNIGYTAASGGTGSHDPRIQINP